MAAPSTIIWPGGTNVSNPGQPDPNDPYSLRAKEYRERYESMRTLEWQVIIQVYVGYAAIAAVFFKIKDEFSHDNAFRIVAPIGTIMFFAAAQYLYYRIQERLIVFNESHRYFVDMAHPELGDLDDSLKPLGLGQDSLKHPYFWTYETQSTLSLLTVLGLLAYECVTSTEQAFFWPAFFGSAQNKHTLSWTTLILTSATAIAVSVVMDVLLRRKYSAIGKKVKKFIEEFKKGDALSKPAGQSS
jgi:hypothetical protein